MRPHIELREEKEGRSRKRSDRRSGGGVEEDEQRSRGCLSPSRRGTSPRHTHEEEERHSHIDLTLASALSPKNAFLETNARLEHLPRRKFSKSTDR